MIPVQGFAGQTVAVLGLGRSGLATARALAAGGATPLCWDDNEEARGRAEAEGFAIDPLKRDDIWAKIVALITSPGIPHLYPKPNPVIARALERGVPVDNDIGLFFRSFATRDWDSFDVLPLVIAVTGSNGKSTTSALIHHVLTEAGRPAQLAGNIGRGVLDIDPGSEGSVVVLELSSYQTELARSLTPDIAVFTNLSPDHLDRHGGMGGYFAAKRRLFALGGPDRAVIGVDEAEGQYLANQLAVSPGDDRVIRITASKATGPGWLISTRKGFLAEQRKARQAGAIDLRAIPGLPGAHNHQNAACAYAACRSLGLAPREIESAFQSFAGLPHRSQRVGERDGVVFVNDSKATNVDSAAKALQAFKRIRWIAGGLEKEGGLDALIPHLGEVRKAYLIGRSAAEFALGLPEATPRAICETMARAVAEAVADAEPGDTVLLAPATASFDQYDSFERRGEDFMTEVQKHL